MCLWTLLCIGVEGSLNEDSGVTISRKRHDYPFVSDVNYNVKKKGEDLIVTSPVNFKFVYDPSVKMSKDAQKKEFENKGKKWQESTNQFFSSMEGKTNKQLSLQYLHL